MKWKSERKRRSATLQESYICELGNQTSYKSLLCTANVYFDVWIAVMFMTRADQGAVQTLLSTCYTASRHFCDDSSKVTTPS